MICFSALRSVVNKLEHVLYSLAGVNSSMFWRRINLLMCLCSVTFDNKMTYNYVVAAVQEQVCVWNVKFWIWNKAGLLCTKWETMFQCCNACLSFGLVHSVSRTLALGLSQCTFTISVYFSLPLVDGNLWILPVVGFIFSSFYVAGQCC